MKRKKLERLIVEIIEDREALIRDMEALKDTPSEAVVPITVFSTIRCTCPPNRQALTHDNYRGSCPIHDVLVTYTTNTARWIA